MKKILVKSLLYQAVYHLATGLVYTLTLAPAVENQLVKNEKWDALKWMVFAYGVICIFVLAFFYIRGMYNDIDARRVYIEETRGKEDKSDFYKNALLEAGIFALASLVFQLPGILISSTIGYGYSNAMLVEMFFICDMGIYERVGVLLGVPIILIMAFFVSSLGKCAVLRSWEKGRIRK